MFKYLTFASVLVLTACSYNTRVSGRVTNTEGNTVSGAEIVLKHIDELRKTVKSDDAGRYEIQLKEPCFLICSGGNPRLSASKHGYETGYTYVAQLETSTHDFVLKAAGASVLNPLPTDFIPGGVYAVDAPTCSRHGGQMSTDGNGTAYCDFGKVDAVFRCISEDGPEDISLLAKGEDDMLVIRGSGAYETLTNSPTGSGEKYVGEHATFWRKGDKALLITPFGDTQCSRVS